ncbi:MAG: hypothetical protein IJU57_04900 [Clostridia bacterium]|nr:hypothetical protein [Clostridia bacterium]
MDSRSNGAIRSGTGSGIVVTCIIVIVAVFASSKLFQLSSHTEIVTVLRLLAAFTGVFLLAPVWAMLCHTWLCGKRIPCVGCAILGILTSLIPSPSLSLAIYTFAAVSVPTAAYILFLSLRTTRFKRQFAISAAAGAVVAGGLIWLLVSGYGSIGNFVELMTARIESFMNQYVVGYLSMFNIGLSETFSPDLTRLIMMRVPEYVIYTAAFLGWITELSLEIISRKTKKQVIHDEEVKPTSIPVSFAFYHAATFLLRIIMTMSTGVGLAVALALSAVSVMPFAVLGKRVLIKRLKEGPRTMVIVGLVMITFLLGLVYLVLAVSLVGAVWRIRYYLAFERRPRQDS